MKQLLILSALIVGLTSPAAVAQPVGNVRMISVSGEAKDEVAPDQAVLHVALTSRGKALAGAKKNNDEMVEKLVGLVKYFEIPMEKVATADVNISPEYNYLQDGKQEFKGYVVSRNMRITLDKVAIAEQVLAAIVDAKIDSVQNVSYGLAAPEVHTSRLQVKAFENARMKAEALAKAAGGKLGQPIAVNAGGNPPPRPYPMPMMALASADMKSAAEAAPPVIAGMISLQENVQVTFPLE